VLRDLDGVNLAVVTCSTREEPLEPLLTYKRNRSPVLWTQPLEPMILRGVPGTGWESQAVADAWLDLGFSDAPKRGQVFRHYKGGLYSIVTVSLEVGTLAPLVTYISNLKGTAWTRTLANFTEDVRQQGDPAPRPRFMREYD
jgi:hypothetical protein